jgi:hypothetical protein
MAYRTLCRKLKIEQNELLKQTGELFVLLFQSSHPLGVDQDIF